MRITFYHSFRRSFLMVSLFLGMAGAAFAQIDIFALMDRTDLPISEVEKIAEAHFAKVGTGQGSGYKQYQRWLYERRFHLNEQGFYVDPSVEDKAYYDAKRNMGLKSRASMNWSELGPNSWNRTSGWNPGVGRVTSVAVNPSNHNIIYVTSPGGGIWKSTNAGSTWSPLVDFVNSSWMSFFNIIIDPNNVNTLYACLYNGGVLKSTNAGSTWTTTGSGPSSSRQVKVHPSNSNIVFAAATNGLWRSTDGAASWTRVETAHKEDIEFQPGNPNIMYASGSSGTSCVWRSTDNGQTWTAITSGSGITNTGRTLLAVSPDDANVVYAVQANGSEFGRLYKSTNAGVSYSTMITGSAGSGTNFFGYDANGTGSGGQATYDMAICVNPSNSDEVIIAGIICWRSVNGGSTFSAITEWFLPNSTGYNHADVHALEWVGTVIYSGSDGGVYKSTNNGGDWTDLSTGLGIRQFYRIACAKTDVNVITTGAQDNGSSFRRTNGTWVDWLGADGMDNIISPTNADIAIGTSQNGSIYKTTNAGASRTNLSKPPGGNWVTPLVMHPTNHDTVYGGWTGVYRSVNGGTNWSSISSIGSNITVMDVSPANTRYIYASVGSTLYRTFNGGSSWTSVAAPASITWIHASKKDPLKIWITCNSSTNRVYVSTDGGTSFTNLSSGLPAVSARSVDVDEDVIETIYVGMNIGVYYRDNQTNTWAEHGTGLPLVAINEVEIQKSGSKLRVATYGRGVWESGLQNVVIPCNDPTGLTASNITSNSADVKWRTVTSATSYSLDYKLNSSGSWINISSSLTDTGYSLSGLTSSSVYDWRVQANCASGNTSLYIQSSFTTPSTCGDPVGLKMTGYTTNSVSVSWSPVTGATSYTLEYRPGTSGSWNSVTGISTNAYTIGSLSAGFYQWQVKAICPSGSGSFTSSEFLLHCASVGLSTNNGYIDNVSLNGMTRVSGSDNGFFDGFGVYTTNLKPGTGYTVTVSPGFSSGKRTTYFRVFIDYNRDGDFTDAGEQVGQKSSKSTGNTTMNFTVPSGANLGLTRMRVSMSTSSYPAACGNISLGEVEEFAINLTNTPQWQNQEPDADIEEGLSVYPIPASDLLNINLTVAESQALVEYRILDASGRAVGGSRGTAIAGDNLLSIDVSTLTSGNYYIMVVMPGQSYTSKFVIAK